jgi:ubiquinone/menaquinone biosynthesis C-methylase UbiE
MSGRGVPMKEHMYEDTYAVEDGYWWFLNLRKILEQSMREAGKETAGLEILDAGCGTGRNLVFYSRYGRVTGVDISMTALYYCRKREICNLILGNTCRLPFRNEIFDVVNSSDVLYAIEPERASDFLEESYRVLKPEGALIINTAAMPILYSDHDQAGMTRKRYLKSEIVFLIRRTKFEIQKVRYWNSALFVPVLVYRLGRKIINAKAANARGDLKMQSWLMNRLLYGIARMDWKLAARLPFGTSLFCVLRKPKPNLHASASAAGNP